MFKFKTYLPARGDYIYSRQITSREQMDVAKIVKNNDPVMIQEYLKTLYNDCVDCDLPFEEMYRVDLFCLLLNIRIVSVSDKLSLMYNIENETKNINIDLYAVLDQTTNAKITHVQTVNLNKSTQLEITTPKGLYDDEYVQSTESTISSVIYMKDRINFPELTTDQKGKILENIPIKSMNILQEMKTQVDNLSIPVVPEKITEQDGVSMEIGLIGQSMFEFIRMCYMSSLPDLYNIRYILAKRCNIDINYIESCPPTDIDAILAIYKKELDEQRKAQAKQSGRNVSLPAQEFVQ